MLELRWAMEPYVAFSDDAILEGATPWERCPEGQTGAAISRKTQPVPPKVPTKEAAPIEEPTEEVPPTKEPTDEIAPWRGQLRSQQQ